MRGLQLGSYCKPKYKYQVTDVTDMVVKGSSGNQTWTETQDHAKWCLTTDGYVVLILAKIHCLWLLRGGRALPPVNPRPLLCYRSPSIVRACSSEKTV